MRQGLALVFALVFALASAGVARSEDASDAEDVRDEPKPASERVDPGIRLSSHRGLTGMREMIDARTPDQPWALRTGAYFQGSSTTIELDRGVRTFQRERYSFVPYVGASFLGHLEVGFRWPFPQFEHTRNRLHDPAAPVLDPWPRFHDDKLNGGGGNFSFSAKAGWTLGPVSLAGYAIGQTNTGSRQQTHKEDSFGELGTAVTVSIAHGLVCVHANVSGVQLASRGFGWQLRFRTGFSAVLVSSDEGCVRTFIYGEGLEAEGSRGCDYYVGGGVQFQVGEHFQVELTGDGRVLSRQLDRQFTDEGTYSVAVGAGFVY